MQLSVMLTEWRTIIGEPDSTNSHFTDAQGKTWANECYRYIQTRIGDLPVKERNYTSASSITLNSNCLTIDRAYILAQPQNVYQKLDVIDLASLESIDPGWISANTGTPRFLVRKDTFTAIPYPPPDTANTGVNIRTYGMEFATELSSDSDTPTLPLNLHDLFPHYMSYRSFQSLGMTEKATAELIFVNSQLKAQGSISTKFSEQRNRWVWQENE